jgi:hypothetical protein
VTDRDGIRQPTATVVLGYGGLLPFAALAAALWFLPEHRLPAQQALIAYAAVILSFVGALHWGFATRAGFQAAPAWRSFGWSVVPALCAWIALLLPAPAALAVLIVTYVVHCIIDRRLVAGDALPAWYLPLRLRLTAGAVTALAAGALA